MHSNGISILFRCFIRGSDIFYIFNLMKCQRNAWQIISKNEEFMKRMKKKQQKFKCKLLLDDFIMDNCIFDEHSVGPTEQEWKTKTATSSKCNG